MYARLFSSDAVPERTDGRAGEPRQSCRIRGAWLTRPEPRFGVPVSIRLVLPDPSPGDAVASEPPGIQGPSSCCFTRDRDASLSLSASADPSLRGGSQDLARTDNRSAVACRSFFTAPFSDAPLSRARRRREASRCVALTGDVPAVYPRVAWEGDSKCLFAGISRSPLTDSNLRPPPYHGGLARREGGRGTVLSMAVFLQLRRFICQTHPSSESPESP